MIDRIMRRRAVALALVAFLAVLIGCSAAPAGAPIGGDDPGDLPAPTPGSPDGELPGELPDGTLVVRTGSLSLEVTDLSAAVDAGRRTVAGFGGYIGTSEERHSAGGGWASVTYRIPVERWEDALAALRGLGRVIGSDSQAQDVTGQVVDLDARIDNLRATEAALQAIMDRAGTIADVLKVQSELTTVRGQIERLVGERDSLANRAALASLTVNYEVPHVAGSQEIQGWDAGREIDAAVNHLVRALQALTSMAIWLGIVVLPILGPPVLVGLVIWRIVRRRQIRATMAASDPSR
jgi:hypothetical protein